MTNNNNAADKKSVSFKCSKMADVEALLPGFKKIWPEIKSMTGTSQRCPKRVRFTNYPEKVYLNDGEMGKRFALNLATMEISGSYHISSGEWACHGGSNNDQEVDEVPVNMAMVTCEYHDYYKMFTMTVQVNPANMPKGEIAALG